MQPNQTMETKDTHSEAWTIPFHVIMWTVIAAGFIMMLVVFLMH